MRNERLGEEGTERGTSIQGRWREAAGEMAEKDADAKAWYALATRLFAVGSATGELIRGRVPTDYRR